MGNCTARSNGKDVVTGRPLSGKSIPAGSDDSKVPPAFVSPEASKTIPFNANPGGKILMKAIRQQNWNQIEYCMKNDIGKYYRDPKHGFTPLHQFIFHRTYETAPNPEAYKKFLAFQAHCVNSADERQATPLHFAIWYAEDKNYHVSYDLLQLGADRTVKDIDGISPAEYADNEAFQARKASFVIEHYDSDSSLQDLISKSTSMDETEGSRKRENAKLSLMITTEDIQPELA